jgi:hypothetical protein
LKKWRKGGIIKIYYTVKIKTKKYMEKLKDLKQIISEQPKKLVEGVIGKDDKNWYEKLPLGVKKEQVEEFLGHDGLYHWHLKPEFIEDEKEKEKYKEESEKWEP